MHDSKTLARLVGLVENPVNKKLKAMLIDIAENDIGKKTVREIEDKMDTITIKAGGTEVPGSDMMALLCDMVGIDSHISMEYTIAAGQHLLIEKLKAKV